MYKYAELTDRIIGVFYAVYNELGPGFLESVYQNALTIALETEGLTVKSEAPISVSFQGRVVGDFKADIIVENKVLLELKACHTLEESHEAQLLNYLRATEIEVGLLLNFGPKPQVKRFAFENTRKKNLR